MRKPLLSALVAFLVVSAGCTGLITGETVAFESEPATVEDSALESTGYELTNSTEQNITRDVTFAGQNRTIRVVNNVRQYQRGVDLGPVGSLQLARFVVVSTPGAKVAGQTLNPAAQWSNRRVVEQFAGRASGVGDVQSEGNRTVEVLGEPRDVGMFSGTVTVQGQEIDVRMHVASFEHEGDVLIVLAVHPKQINERARVDTMFGGITHSGD
ncbi:MULTISPECIES: DUF6517 family protein [Haloarcula]|uniref:Uncharacterized protein n=1 Tax=Haloarcula pellucida TaxID=1427151 RepID=A0A830GM17_9EURY|nr:MULTISPECIES: DUF6517 family protein [Halomicroarcula]MBX0348014.1 hypothetical protein [Halomicroarcula pellucida]MDS0280442.1 DUF6517 family protein [Halomicroarcula sp. S1AR25-4]GGN96514.1 hypothetical protein GCM10009030_24860 [Halomicroarcula pellucida]